MILIWADRNQDGLLGFNGNQDGLYACKAYSFYEDFFALRLLSWSFFAFLDSFSFLPSGVWVGLSLSLYIYIVYVYIYIHIMIYTSVKVALSFAHAPPGQSRFAPPGLGQPVWIADRELIRAASTQECICKACDIQWGEGAGQTSERNKVF